MFGGGHFSLPKKVFFEKNEIGVTCAFQVMQMGCGIVGLEIDTKNMWILTK